MESSLAIIREVIDEKEAETRRLADKHSWFNIAYNYLVVVCVVALGISFYVWGVNAWADNRAENRATAALASYKEEKQKAADADAAAEKAAYEAEEAVNVRIAKKLAQVYYGADKFREKYHYTKEDFDTLGRCAFNRAWNMVYNPFYPEVNQTLEPEEGSLFELRMNAVIDQGEQWVGYYSTNPVQAPYYDWALELVHTCRAEDVHPVSNAYLWAEYTERGIFLKNDYNADGYAPRWRAGQ